MHFTQPNRPIFLIGYYGHNNLGDELLCQQSQKILQDQWGDITFEILGHSVKRTQVIGATWRAKKVVFGGGSLFQDTTSKRSLIFYLGLVFLARLFRKEILFLGQGLGPLSLIGQWLFKLIVPNKTWIMRDTESANLLKKICPKAQVQIAADLCFYQDHFQPSLPGTKIGVSIRSVSYQLPADLISEIKKHQPESDYLLFQPGPDTKATLEIVNSTDLIQFTDFDSAKKAYSNYKFVIGMRYHSLVLAAICGVPFIAIAYDPKVAALAKQLGQPIWAQNCLADMIQNQEKFREKLIQKVPTLISSLKTIKL